MKKNLSVDQNKIQHFSSKHSMLRSFASQVLLLLLMLCLDFFFKLENKRVILLVCFPEFLSVYLYSTLMQTAVRVSKGRKKNEQCLLDRK